MPVRRSTPGVCPGHRACRRAHSRRPYFCPEALPFTNPVQRALRTDTPLSDSCVQDNLILYGQDNPKLHRRDFLRNPEIDKPEENLHMEMTLSTWHIRVEWGKNSQQLTTICCPWVQTFIRFLEKIEWSSLGQPVPRPWSYNTRRLGTLQDFRDNKQRSGHIPNGKPWTCTHHLLWDLVWTLIHRCCRRRAHRWSTVGSTGRPGSAAADTGWKRQLQSPQSSPHWPITVLSTEQWMRDTKNVTGNSNLPLRLQCGVLHHPFRAGITALNKSP